MDSDGFVKVTKKSRRGKWVNKKDGRVKQISSAEDDNQVDRGYVMRGIAMCREELSCSEFWRDFKGSLDQVCCCGRVDDTEAQTRSLVQQIVCYGLGNFSTCPIARYQLALLLALRTHLKVEAVDCYDPLFKDEEKSILCDLDLDVIRQNEEGKRKAETITLFYMPHCGRPLYNNLLWANWNPESLSKVVIIGNSFHNMSERTPERILKEESSYIAKILPYTSEVPVKNNFQHTDIFHDTAIHTFQKSQLGSMKTHLWQERPEPKYEKHAEIIQGENPDS